MIRFIGIGIALSSYTRRSASEMADLITSVILLTFGGAMAVIVAGFYVMMHRSRNLPFRSDDYANYTPRTSKPKYYPRDVFRREEDRFHKANANRNAVVVVVLLLVLLVSVALAGFFFDTLDLLLFLILLSPFLFRLLRVQRRENDEERRRDDDKRSSS